MTQESINVYRAKQQAAQNKRQSECNLIAKTNTAESDQALQALNDAKSGLRANKKNYKALIIN